MAKENCINTVTILSFFVGGLLGVSVALLMGLQLGEIRERIKSAIGRREKLSREQIIEEGIQCAVPEGADMCYPGQEERE